MSSAQILGWKKIGKKIGKKLRDVIGPPAEDGPTKEERRLQQLLDVFKGFAYFDNFNEVEAWQRASVDPIQRANIPLIPRTGCEVASSPAANTRVLLCHDYNGGYHDYESVRPSLLNEKKYFCNYLQYVDTFVYFSHKLVSCPPPTWTNTLHRNGVKVLGTFVVEPQTPNIEQMLDRRDGEFILAKQLSAMAKAYGFDGWLLNIEKEFPFWSVDRTTSLVKLIRDLKRLLGLEGKVIWYDALTNRNEVEYQNGLSLRNIEFAKAADALFTNYKWTDIELNNAKINAQWHALDLANVFFGIDVWAQNTNMQGPRRVTYPPDGGGGTLTGLATRKLAENGFSSAVFGPAWTHEHFPESTSGRHIAERVDQAVWEGKALPTDLYCSCKKGKPHQQKDYQLSPIVNSARKTPVGSETFFETDFRNPFERIDVPGNASEYQFRSRIGFTTPQPKASHGCGDFVSQNTTWATHSLELFGQHAYHPTLTDQPGSPSNSISFYRISLICTRGFSIADLNIKHEDLRDHRFHMNLFDLDMPADGTLMARVLCRRTADNDFIDKAGLYFTYAGSNDETWSRYIEIPVDASAKSYDIPISALLRQESLGSGHGRLKGFGTFCNGIIIPTSMSQLPVLEIYDMRIGPQLEHYKHPMILNLRVLDRKSGQNTDKRLAWDWSYPHHTWPTELPWSQTTGCFERFDVDIEGKPIGEVCCTELPLREQDFHGLENEDEVKVTVKGYCFGGGYVEQSDTVAQPYFV